MTLYSLSFLALMKVLCSIQFLCHSLAQWSPPGGPTSTLRQKHLLSLGLAWWRLARSILCTGQSTFFQRVFSAFHSAIIIHWLRCVALPWSLLRKVTSLIGRPAVR